MHDVLREPLPQSDDQEQEKPESERPDFVRAYKAIKLKLSASDSRDDFEHVLAENKRVFSFARELQIEHPECVRYRLYDWLVGGSDTTDMVDGDFKGKYSIEGFMREFIDRHQALLTDTSE